MMRHVAANALTLLIVGLVLMFGVILWGQARYQAAGPLPAPVVIEVERGEALSTVATKLAEAGAIDSAPLFRVAARYTKQDAGLRFGEYQIPAGGLDASDPGAVERGRQRAAPDRGAGGADQLAGGRAHKRPARN